MHGSRFRHRRLRLGRLGAGLPPVRGRPPLRDRHRIWRHRFRTVHPDAGGAVLSDEHEPLRLGIHLTEPEPHLGGRVAGDAARQGARRLVLHQRHGLCARPCPRFRPLGRAGRGGLGLCRRAPLLQAHGDIRMAAKRAGAARTARCMSSADRARIRSTRRSSRRAGRPASRSPPTTTARSRKASARWSRRSSMAAAGLPPTPICGRH